MDMKPFNAAATLALLLAIGMFTRIYSQHSGFHRVVRESLATSEGYDQKFIDLVHHLEEILTTRASFPFLGGSDPMTGRRRELVATALPSSRVRPPASPKSSTTKAAPVDRIESAPEPAISDNVRLTAIIADEYGQHTAIVMNGERSLSVDVGDLVGDRKVIRISSKDLVMADEALIYTYNLSGARSQQPK